MNQAILDLKKEHEVALEALSVFLRMLDVLEVHQTSFNDDYDSILEFFHLFIDRRHHEKEEHYLFPTMVAAGVPDRGGPIGVMMAEHIQGRGFLFSMSESLEDEPLDIPGFIKAGRNYIKLLESHIQKENDILYPMAEKMIAVSFFDTMFENFQDHDKTMAEQGNYKQFRDFLNIIKMKY